MSGVNVDAALKRIGDYADQVASADDHANRDTMAVADELAELFESKVWVEEWLEHKPQPKRPPNNWKPDSRSRFAGWVAWRLEQENRRPILGRHTYQLLDGHAVKAAVPALRQAQIREERSLRPLKWLLRYRYRDRIPEVWERAVALAGSPEAVTSAHTREALADWKRDVLGVSGVKSAVKQAKAATLRTRAASYFDQLVELAQTDTKAKAELVKLMQHVDEVLPE